MCPPGNCPFANDLMITHALGQMMCDMSTPCHESPVTSFINSIYIINMLYIIYIIYMYIIYINSLLINALMSNYYCLIK